VGAAYSHRFCFTLGGPSDFQVPSTKRAVVKCLTATNPLATAATVYMAINGNPVVSRVVAAGSGLELTQLMICVEPAETLRVYIAAPGVAQLSGYLLDV
jgi:hypothetical protein